MADQFEQARDRAKLTIQDKWRSLAAVRTVGWGGPPAVVAQRFAFLRTHLDSLGTRVTSTLPVMVFQSRQSPPQQMELAVAYRDEAGNPFNCRLVSTNALSKEAVELRNDFAQAVWFLLEQRVLPPADDADGLLKVLSAWTGPDLFALSP